MCIRDRSRGINKEDAEKLLIKGFFNEVINEDAWDIIHDEVADTLTQKYENILDRNSLLSLKEKKIKTCLWYEDHVAYYGPSWQSNLNLIEKNNDLIDKYFITTHPDALKTKISKNKLKQIVDNFSKNTKSEIMTVSTLKKNSISKVKAKLISYAS